MKGSRLCSFELSILAFKERLLVWIRAFDINMEFVTASLRFEKTSPCQYPDWTKLVL
jgi:hypothetical protein